MQDDEVVGPKLASDLVRSAFSEPAQSELVSSEAGLPVAVRGGVVAQDVEELEGRASLWRRRKVQPSGLDPSAVDIGEYRPKYLEHSPLGTVVSRHHDEPAAAQRSPERFEGCSGGVDSLCTDVGFEDGDPAGLYGVGVDARVPS
jgi:hypothetical protein